MFLFFGWFRQVERRHAQWRYVHGAPDLHVIWGWLQAASVLVVRDMPSPPAWLGQHEHFRARTHLDPANTVYTATDHLVLGGKLLPGVAGAGVVRGYRPELVLTAPDGGKRSIWRLPTWFAPREARRPLSCHERRERWTEHGDHVRLQTVGRGQEFVLDADEYPEALPWARALLAPEGAPDEALALSPPANL